MDPKDLLRMFDLDGKPPDAPKESGVVVPAPAGVTPPADASPTALAVDAWGLRRGRDLVADSDRLRAAGTDEFAAADFFSAAFDPDPRLNEACADPRRHEFLAQLVGAPALPAFEFSRRSQCRVRLVLELVVDQLAVLLQRVTQRGRSTCAGFAMALRNLLLQLGEPTQCR